MPLSTCCGNRPLRALILSKVTESHGPGGMQRHLSWVVEWLTRAGWDLTVATTEGGATRPADHVRMEIVPGARAGRYGAAWWSGTSRLVRTTPLHAWDAIISENGGAWSVIRALRREPRRPPVVMFRHGTTLLNLAQNVPPLTVRGAVLALASIRDYVRFARPLSRHVDLMVAPSQRIADSVRRESGGRVPVQVVPLGVDLVTWAPAANPAAARIALGLEAGVTTLLWVGRDVPGKRVDVAIRAFDALKASGDPFQLLVVADRAAATTRRELDRLQQRWGRATCLIENASVPQLQQAYAAADVELFPSSLPEGVPLVILEALASGVPVLSADTPALRQVPALRDQPEWFVAGPSIGSWVERIRQLTAEPTLARAKATARGLAERHCDQRATERGTLDAIHAAVRARRR